MTPSSSISMFRNWDFAKPIYYGARRVKTTLSGFRRRIFWRSKITAFSTNLITITTQILTKQFADVDLAISVEYDVVEAYITYNENKEFLLTQSLVD